jgi:arginyl-tRNA synthetase
MRSVLEILEKRISAVMVEVTGQAGCSAQVKPATDPKFGDYQVNGVMPLAKQLKTNLSRRSAAKTDPRKLAEQIISKLDVSDICEQPEVAGPGFINLRLKPEFVADNLAQVSKDAECLGVEKADKPKTIVVDFSGPNIAKQMHVGHLRSTIIGDCICRLLEFEGHKVIRQNHIGDWGTALGKVILGLWHWCMDEKKHNNELYYKTELIELKNYAENKEKLKILCHGIRNRHEKDWEEDFCPIKGDGKKYFGPFLDEIKQRKDEKIWEKITFLYQYVNLLEESLVGMDLMIPTRVKKKSYKRDENPFKYISIPYESLSRHITTMLQNIDDKDNAQEKYAWKRIRKISIKYCQKIYERLNVNLKLRDIRGESYYRKRKRLVLVV